MLQDLKKNDHQELLSPEFRSLIYLCLWTKVKFEIFGSHLIGLKIILSMNIRTIVWSSIEIILNLATEASAH